MLGRLRSIGEGMMGGLAYVVSYAFTLIELLVEPLAKPSEGRSLGSITV